jgi:hypothetical protein
VIEVVRDSGQKLQFLATSNVSVRRPNKLRSDRRGEVVDASFLYNGKTITVYGKRMNMYAQTTAPPTIDEALDYAQSRLDLDAPGVDLIYSNAYKALTEDVVSGMRVGPAFIGDVPCQHLAYRGNAVDWQLWIQDGAEPLPLKYVITTKDVKSSPEFSVEFRDWETSAVLPDELFEFTPPAGAQRIEFLGLLEQRRAPVAR